MTQIALAAPLPAPDSHGITDYLRAIACVSAILAQFGGFGVHGRVLVILG